MAKKRKKISLSREFYERHEWIQRNLAERIEVHKKLREQRPQQRD
jgi:DNA-binding XRE family transcriptional regulator